jgi:hypothetical protein
VIVIAVPLMFAVPVNKTCDANAASLKMFGSQ